MSQVVNAIRLERRRGSRLPRLLGLSGLLVVAGIVALRAGGADAARSASASAAVTDAEPARPGTTLTYRYTAGGAERTGRDLVDWYRPGMAIEACYAPGDPDDARAVRAGTGCRTTR